jgi:signal transduction histidine kinase/HAMP domain-containing protein
MLSFRDLSLRRKQTLIIMLTSSVVLLLACAAFVTYDVLTFRRELIGRTSVLAEAIGNNCAAAIDFNDPKTAGETLTALHAEDNIVFACVYSRDGQVFAVYQRGGASSFVPPAPRATGQEFTSDQLRLFRPIKQRGVTTGMIFVASDLKELSAGLMHYISIAGVVFLASLLVALALSSRLQRLVSDPILQLARMARSVAQDKDYSMRASKQSDDELGQLVDGFNEMLAQIQRRDAALQTARDHLEKRVEERTRDFTYERDLLRSLLDNSPDSIFFKDLQSRLVNVSRSEVANLFRIALSWHRDLHPGESADRLPAHLASVERFRKYVIGKTDADTYGSERAGAFNQDEREIIRTGRPMIGKIEQTVCPDGDTIWHMTTKVPWRNKDGEIIGTFGTSRDISDLKNAEAKIEETHKQLLEASRKAGMAEIATNVLHNVGNVLNSVNISATLVVDSVKKSKTSSLAKVVALLREHEGDLAAFITNDSRGKHVPALLAQLSEHLMAEQAAIVSELDSLRRNVEHIKEIVAMQQNYATFGGVKEVINVVNLVEDSLRMNVGALSRHRVEVIREFEEVPPLNVEKHKILQILVNLVRNAKYACNESGRADKRLTMRVANGDGRVKISVIDNGVGIPPENLIRIFNHGFTTRKDGHGFGLHSGVLAAKEMGGSLTVHSDGPGQGAAFTLELPCPTLENSHE